jgi:glutaredoxin-like YruB-family protein
MEIKIYSTPTCPYCIQAKKYLTAKKVPFTDIDVATDKEKAQEMIDLSGQMGVPVIKINDKIIIGFDQEKIDDILRTTK